MTKLKYSIIRTDESKKPEPTCSNPGDHLIGQNAISIINKMFDCECVADLDYDNNSQHDIDTINSGDVLFYATFTFCKSNQYKIGFDSIDDNFLKQIKVPIIPVTSSCLLRPQNIAEYKKYKLEDYVTDFINSVKKSTGKFPVRDMFTKFILENNGISDVELVGDCALYNFCNPIQKMKQPEKINKIILTVGHYNEYNNQIIDIAKYVRNKFPDAEIIYSTHVYPNKAFKFPEELGIKTVDSSVFSDKIEFYKDCDLHIGYRLHGHIKSLSVGVPSILLTEDSRGLGQKYTLGNIGGFIPFNINMIGNKQINAKMKYKNIFEKIFSVKNECINFHKRKVLTIFGIKFKFNKSIVNKETFTKSSDILIKEIDEFIDTQIVTKWTFYSNIPLIINGLYDELKLYMKNSIKNIQGLAINNR